MKNIISLLVFMLLICNSRQGEMVAQDFSGHVGPRYSVGGDDPANGIYVSPTGNDATANGTKDRPYKSIITALKQAQPGATIILRGGTYREGRYIRVQKSNITIKSAKGEWAVIDLTTYDPGNNEHSAIEFFAENDITGSNVTGCKLQSIEVMGGYYAVSFGTMWDYGKPDRSGASDIIIEDCILHHSSDDVVKVKPNCNNITIRYNEIHHSGQRFASQADFNTGDNNAEGIDNVNGANMHVHNNYIYDICSTGIYAKGGATDAVIEKNRIERTFAGGIMVGFDTNLEWFDEISNPQYYENIRGVVRNNLIIDAGWQGIGIYSSKDAQVYNNTVVNAVCGVQQYHGAISFGVSPQDWDEGIGHPANVNPDIHHNIVCLWPNSNRPMIIVEYSDECGGMSSLTGKPTMNNNCYYAPGKNATFSDIRPDNELSAAGLAAWKTHIGSDNNSIEVNPSLNADYIATNPQCAGMGIQTSLRNNPTGTIPPTLPPETVATLINGALRINNPVIETVQGYSISGALLFNFLKPSGIINYSVNQPKGSIFILKGSSGWTKKLIAQ